MLKTLAYPVSVRLKQPTAYVPYSVRGRLAHRLQRLLADDAEFLLPLNLKNVVFATHMYKSRLDSDGSTLSDTAVAPVDLVSALGAIRTLSSSIADIVANLGGPTQPTAARQNSNVRAFAALAHMNRSEARPLRLSDVAYYYRTTALGRRRGLDLSAFSGLPMLAGHYGRLSRAMWRVAGSHADALNAYLSPESLKLTGPDTASHRDISALNDPIPGSGALDASFLLARPAALGSQLYAPFGLAGGFGALSPGYGSLVAPSGELDGWPVIPRTEEDIESSSGPFAPLLYGSAALSGYAGAIGAKAIDDAADDSYLYPDVLFDVKSLVGADAYSDVTCSTLRLLKELVALTFLRDMKTLLDIPWTIASPAGFLEVEDIQMLKNPALRITFLSLAVAHAQAVYALLPYVVLDRFLAAFMDLPVVKEFLVEFATPNDLAWWKSTSQLLDSLPVPVQLQGLTLGSSPPIVNELASGTQSFATHYVPLAFAPLLTVRNTEATDVALSDMMTLEGVNVPTHTAGRWLPILPLDPGTRTFARIAPPFVGRDPRLVTAYNSFRAALRLRSALYDILRGPAGFSGSIARTWERLGSANGWARGVTHEASTTDLSPQRVLTLDGVFADRPLSASDVSSSLAVAPVVASGEPAIYKPSKEPAPAEFPPPLNVALAHAGVQFGADLRALPLGLPRGLPASDSVLAVYRSATRVDPSAYVSFDVTSDWAPVLAGIDAEITPNTEEAWASKTGLSVTSWLETVASSEATAWVHLGSVQKTSNGLRWVPRGFSVASGPASTARASTRWFVPAYKRPGTAIIWDGPTVVVGIVGLSSPYILRDSVFPELVHTVSETAKPLVTAT